LRELEEEAAVGETGDTGAAEEQKD